MTNLICRNESRRENVRRQGRLNGLDYLEVSNRQRKLIVYFLGKAAVSLGRENIRIDGGQRIRAIGIRDVTVHHVDTAELDDYMEVVIERPGDFSPYTLRVVEKNEQGEWRPHSAFDPRYDRITFNFKVDCPGELDCKSRAICPPSKKEEPDINYLAKDFASFRQLILDRMALVLPKWRERHIPDLGVALVDVLAYVGDHLSYYQDAVATEAYLDTARMRVSVRRHARLVDYAMHEGCNARAWVCIETDSDLRLNPDEVFFITSPDAVVPAGGSTLHADDLALVPPHSYEVFEPMDRETIRLYRDNSRMYFYTWGDSECCLPRGATRATLAGRLFAETNPAKPSCSVEPGTGGVAVADGMETESDAEGGPPAPVLHLAPGDVIVFEEMISPETGHRQDADPGHRHAVRLTSVIAGRDPLTAQSVVEIIWSEDDALPFALCLSSLGRPPDCKMIDRVSIAWGNVLLVDHGRRKEEELGPVPAGASRSCCREEGIPSDTVTIARDFRPHLAHRPLTFRQQLTGEMPAAHCLEQDARRALPVISLEALRPGARATDWVPRIDLLASGPDDPNFVVEIDNDRRATLRFGDDECGQKPAAGTHFVARYRIGNGPAGNVGAGTISFLVVRSGRLEGGGLRIRNPLPARGGIAEESLAEVRLFAPHLFRKRLQRAVIADDYARIAEREFRGQIQRAVAKLCWTGSWHEVVVAIDPLGREEAPPELLKAIRNRLNRYRRMGHDLRVVSARRVPLDIALTICVRPDYLRGHVREVMFGLFSNRLLADGSRGFFHPDNLSFGEGVYLSRLIAAAQAVEGVESVQVTRLQRLQEPAGHEIENGFLPLGPYEIALLDNDPNMPEKGRLQLDMRGGR